MKVRAGSMKIRPKLVPIDKLLARLIKEGKTEREPKLIKSEIKMEKLQPMPQKYNG